MPLKALIFDIDGTLAETEETHRASFNQAFKEFGLNWHWSTNDYKQLLATTGGKERIATYMATIGAEVGRPVPIDISALHKRKTEIYVKAVHDGEIMLRPGVEALVSGARNAGLKLAIATTTSRPNVDALLTSALGRDAAGWFDAIVCGDEVAKKKPDPAVYRLALEKLGLQASECIAFEDSQPGLKAAVAAQLSVIVTPGLYTQGDDFRDADLVLDGLDKRAANLVVHSPRSIAVQNIAALKLLLPN